MFYEKLAQAKQEKKRLSTGQKVGVGVSALGAGLGAKALIDKSISDRNALGKFFLNNKYSREAQEMMSAGKAARSAYMEDVVNPIKQDLDQVTNRLKRARANPSLMSGASKVDAAKKQTSLRRQYDRALRESPMTDFKNIRDLKGKAATRRKLTRGGAIAAGGLAIGYGAKKLFDRFNQRKQQRD